MRFALLGEHLDGLAMARALTASGRHELAIFSGTTLGAESLGRFELHPARVGDLEEVLADPQIEAVIVAGSPGARANQMRRALQAERHVLCVHPADQSPDTAYEMAMLQNDVGVVLLPLLPEAFHPGVRRLADWIRGQGRTRAREVDPELREAIVPDETATRRERSPAAPSFNAFRLLEVQRCGEEEVLLDTGLEAHEPGVPGWEVLRLLGGELAEVNALARREDLDGRDVLLLTGQFMRGGLVSATFLPDDPQEQWRLVVVHDLGRAELQFDGGWPGPARLTFTDAAGASQTESWPALDPWPALVEVFETALARLAQQRATAVPGGTANDSLTATGRLGWQDEVRALELDDAVRRSVSRRRATKLEYQEATEEASFKGTMTLLGCSLLWISLLLLVLSIWAPWLGWLILPVFGVFLVLQFLRGVLPQTRPTTEDPDVSR